MIMKLSINYQYSARNAYHSSSLKNGEYFEPIRPIPLLLMARQGWFGLLYEEGNLEQFFRWMLPFYTILMSFVPKPMLDLPQYIAQEGLSKSYLSIKSRENILVAAILSHLSFRLSFLFSLLYFNYGFISSYSLSMQRSFPLFSYHFK